MSSAVPVAITRVISRCGKIANYATTALRINAEPPISLQELAVHIPSGRIPYRYKRGTKRPLKTPPHQAYRLFSGCILPKIRLNSTEEPWPAGVSKFKIT